MKGPDQPAAGFIDIEMQRPPARFLWIAAAVLCWFIFLLAGVVVAHILIQDYEQLIVAIIAFGPCLVLLILLVSMRARQVRTIRNLVLADAEACANYVAERFQKGHGPYIFDMVKSLIRAQRANVTIRMCPALAADPVAPLTIEFDPLLLNDSDPAFLEFETAIDAGETHESAVRPTPESANHEIASRTISRNVRLKGGWFAVVFFGSFVAITAIVSFLQRKLEWSLAGFAIMVIAMLFQSPISSRSSPRQLLLVPGGLVLRRPARNPHRSGPSVNFAKVSCRQLTRPDPARRRPNTGFRQPDARGSKCPPRCCP
jgi:hypothetical protein